MDTREVHENAPDRQDVLAVPRSHDEARKYYNRISPIYDFLAERSERRARVLGLELLEIKESEKILEVGFGTGHSLVTLARDVGPRGKVFGIDISEGMSEIARARLARAGFFERAELTCGDATRLPYLDRVMDGVFMSFTLELFDTREMPVLLSECRRVLRAGGRIVVVGMSKDGEAGPCAPPL